MKALTINLEEGKNIKILKEAMKSTRLRATVYIFLIIELVNGKEQVNQNLV
ncbi:MAG: hypothetical protein ACRCVJ_11760 [Clostridium sp.]|uniref:hypothetical protein n=1 Tax=Clostridium sp. TaxID=1506 RepID=UPI003F355D89